MTALYSVYDNSKDEPSSALVCMPPHWAPTSQYIYIYACLFIYIYICVCVCVHFFLIQTLRISAFAEGVLGRASRDYASLCIFDKVMHTHKHSTNRPSSAPVCMPPHWAPTSQYIYIYIIYIYVYMHVYLYICVYVFIFFNSDTQNICLRWRCTWPCLNGLCITVHFWQSYAYTQTFNKQAFFCTGPVVPWLDACVSMQCTYTSVTCELVYNLYIYTVRIIYI